MHLCVFPSVRSFLNLYILIISDLLYSFPILSYLSFYIGFNEPSLLLEEDTEGKSKPFCPRGVRDNTRDAQFAIPIH